MSQITPNNGSEFSSNLRIATFAIAAFDFIQTLPGEYYLYKKQWNNRRISVVCWLFVIVRYMSIACLLVNGVGFYSKTFTSESCKNFYLSPLMTKMIAGLASQGIIFSRTYAISRNRTTLIVLCVLCVLILPLQILGNSYKRHPVVGTGAVEGGNCTAKRFAGDFNSAPLYYLANVIFDVVACAIASVSLLRRQSVLGNLSLFTKKVLKHGLLYAFAATVTNFLVFLALMEIPGLKNLGAFVSVAVIMILSQHLVLATVNTTSDSSQESSSWEIRERSKSREGAQRRTIGGTGANVTRIIGARDRTGSAEGRLDRIELGGIRIHTETEVHGQQLQSASSLSRPDSMLPLDTKRLSATSLDDLSNSDHDQYVNKLEKRSRDIKVATAV